MDWQVLGSQHQDNDEYYAKKYCPIIVQEIKSIKDFPTGIVLAPFPDVEKILPSVFLDPTLYYRISEDDNYVYAFYMVFHPFDWSDSPIDFINTWDSHQYDTESIVFRVPNARTVSHQGVDVLTVCHHNFRTHRYKKDENWRKVFIESCGHGIYPWGESPQKWENKSKLMTYNQGMKLQSLDKNKKQWDRVKLILNQGGVHFVDQQKDARLLRTNNACPDRLRHYPGDMFNKPHILFERAEMERLF